MEDHQPLLRQHREVVHPMMEVNMAEYKCVSTDILWDLMNAKSKLTDVELYVDAHQNELASINALGPLRRILDSVRYGEGVETFGTQA